MQTGLRRAIQASAAEPRRHVNVLVEGLGALDERVERFHGEARASSRAWTGACSTGRSGGPV